MERRTTALPLRSSTTRLEQHLAASAGWVGVRSWPIRPSRAMPWWLPPVGGVIGWLPEGEVRADRRGQVPHLVVRSLVAFHSRCTTGPPRTERRTPLESQTHDATDHADELADHIRELGERVASNVKELAKSLNAANFDLDASWFEPGHATARATVSAGVAGWRTGARFCEDELIGVAHTLSDAARWRIDTEDGPRYVDVSVLRPEAFEVPRLRQTIRLRVLVQPTERPDGASLDTYTALEFLDLEP